MTRSNLSLISQLGFKQPTYTMPKPQGAIIGCRQLRFVSSDVEPNFVRDHQFVKIPLQIPRGTLQVGTLTLCEPIEFGNVHNDTNQELYHIFSGRKRLSLIKPIEFTSYFRDGVWTMENKDLEVISMSPDYKECLRDFNEEVFFVWEEYGQEDDDKLTNGAKALKRKILRHIIE